MTGNEALGARVTHCWPTTLRTATAVALFAFQLAGIAYARFAPTRYVAWAPYDRITFYELDVRIDDRSLSPGEIRRRYRIPAAGRDNRSQAHVMAIVRQYEQTYGAGDGARVRMRYRVNGAPPEVWRWPR